jgi:homoserine O-acetyltransferase
MLVEKKVFTLPRYETVGGEVIHDLRIGYETYGTPRGDNAILVTHYFSGTSHCAGRYEAGDAAPGYWDSIIGPGKAIDTDRFFVISSDTLVNVNAHDPRVVTTGPASLDPRTGRPYGMRFPHVTLRDFVHVQRALVESLGIHKLHAVAGPSMGAMQAMEWAASFPELVDRVINVIGAGLETEPFTIAQSNAWRTPILLDPRWNNGDYYDQEPPTRGLAAAFELVTLTARHPAWARQAFGNERKAIESGLRALGAMRAKVVDANHFLYMVKAIQSYSLHEPTPRVGNIRARVLFIPVASDVCMFADYSHRAAKVLREQGNPVEVFELQTDGGHLDGLFEIHRATDVIRAFLF